MKKRKNDKTEHYHWNRGRKIVFVLLALSMLYCMYLVNLYTMVFDTMGERTATLHYLDLGARETLSTNLVNSIVWDYRGYDTLGEETVLYAAIVGVAIAARATIKTREGEE